MSKEPKVKSVYVARSASVYEIGKLDIWSNKTRENEFYTLVDAMKCIAFEINSASEIMFDKSISDEEKQFCKHYIEIAKNSKEENPPFEVDVDGQVLKIPDNLTTSLLIGYPPLLSQCITLYGSKEALKQDLAREGSERVVEKMYVNSFAAHSIDLFSCGYTANDFEFEVSFDDHVVEDYEP